MAEEDKAAKLGSYSRTPDEQSRALDLYEKSQQALKRIQLSNSEMLDQTFLLTSLASFFGCISGSFLASGPHETAGLLLKFSAANFLMVILILLASYIVGNLVAAEQLRISHDYYIKGLRVAESEKNRFASVYGLLHTAKFLFFVPAAVTSCFTIFYLI